MRNKPVFVFDTNPFVSMALFKGSPVRFALQKAEALGKVVLSAEILVELGDVLLRAKFDRYLSVEERLEYIKRIERRYSIMPITANPVRVCRDAMDNHLLELALSINASAIVTGDDDLLVLNPFQGIPILNPADFISMSF